MALEAFGLALSLGVLGALVACGDGAAPGSRENLGETESALFSNDKAAFDYFRGKGLSKVQAAGIVGNLDQESGGDPGAVQPGGPGRGIAQWSVGGRWNADANDNAVAYAAAHGKSVTTLALQLDFVWYELTTFPGYGLVALEKATTVADATQVFATDFEACGTCLQSKRVTYAQAVLAAYGNDVIDAGSDGGGDAGKGHDASAPKPDGGGGDGGVEPVDPPATSADPASASGTGSANDAPPALADTAGCSTTPRRSGDAWISLLAAGAVILARLRPRAPRASRQQNRPRLDRRDG